MDQSLERGDGRDKDESPGLLRRRQWEAAQALESVSVLMRFDTVERCQLVARRWAASYLQRRLTRAELAALERHKPSASEFTPEQRHAATEVAAAIKSARETFETLHKRHKKHLLRITQAAISVMLKAVDAAEYGTAGAGRGRSTSGRTSLVQEWRIKRLSQGRTRERGLDELTAISLYAGYYAQEQAKSFIARARREHTRMPNKSEAVGFERTAVREILRRQNPQKVRKKTARGEKHK